MGPYLALLHTSWKFNGLAGGLALLTLVIGLLTIAMVQDQKQLDDIAAVDVELLAVDLPPDAYTDPGFVHFLGIDRHD